MAGLWQQLEHPVPAGVLVVVALALLTWAGRGLVHAVRLIADMDRYVTPHFRPQPDEHGVLNDGHTIPARLDSLGGEMKELRTDLVDHMAAEEKLRTADIERHTNEAEERAARDTKLDAVIARLEAGNPEVRPAP